MISSASEHDGTEQSTCHRCPLNTVFRLHAVPFTYLLLSVAQPVGPKLRRIGRRVHCTELSGALLTEFNSHATLSEAFQTLDRVAPTPNDRQMVVYPNPHVISVGTRSWVEFRVRIPPSLKGENERGAFWGTIQSTSDTVRHLSSTRSKI